MRVRRPVTVALEALSESGPTVTSLPERVADRLVDAERVVSRLPGPRWLASPSEVRLGRDLSDPSTYRSTVGQTVRVEPETPFTRLDVAVDNTDDLEACHVVGQFELADGTDLERSRRFTASDDHSFADRIPVTFEFDRPVRAASVELETPGVGDRVPARLRVLDRLSSVDLQYSRPGLELPAPRASDGGSPIVLISIDALRYDQRAALEPLIAAFDGDGAIVQEPRTQGHWTAPSHGSMFTGLHPGDHGYVGFAKGYAHPLPMDPGLTTLSSLLADAQYKCSALVSHTRILPEFGFGDGFHRFRLNRMDDWLERSPDARTSVDDLLAWMDEDADGRHDSLFYFLHVFDPHLPYVPPLWMLGDLPLDLEAVENYTELARGNDYREIRDTSFDVPAETLDLLRRYYSKSVRYTAMQVARVVERLKRRSLYDDALVIVVGDHGEEFLERGFYTHSSLYDANIRPFMYVKPPTDARWSVPEEADYIDILPTVARAIGVDPPAQCQGTPWQDDDPPEFRITERIRLDCYNIAVELDGLKGIFTYEENYPDRPSDEQVSNGPIDEGFVHLESVRQDGDPRPDLVGQSVREKLRERAARFLERAPVRERERSPDRPAPSQDTDQRLQMLGYK